MRIPASSPGRSRRARWVAAVVALVGSTAALLVPATAVSAATPPAGVAGALDASFGSAGIATISVPGTALTSLTRVLVQNDGKVVVGGLQPGLINSVTVGRLNANGSLDTTFGGGAGYVRPGIGSASTQDSAQIALQPDGKIIVVGSDAAGGKVSIARLQTNGSLDPTFGTAGITRTALSGSPLVHASGVVVLTSGALSGKIVVSSWAGASGNFTLLRYNANGTLDTTFGTNGIAQATTAAGPVEAQDLALTADGKFVVVGIAKVSSKYDTAVARFTSSGQADKTFPGAGSKNGTTTFDVGAGSNETPMALSIDTQGRLVITGTINSTPTKSFVLRLTSAGMVDNTFGTAGSLKGTFGGVAATGGASALDGNQRLLVTGGDGPSTTNAIGIERLLESGAYDSSFGLSATPGRETVECTGSSAGAGITVQSNQQVLVAGNCAGALRVVRLNVGNLSNLTMSTSTPTAPAGHGNIPLSSLPSSSLLTAAPGFGAPGFGAPGFGAPGFGMPGFGAPGFGAPGFGAPGFGAPGFGAPGFGAPGFGMPVTDSPLLSQELGPIPLAMLPLTPSETGGPARWEDVYAGTIYDGLSTQIVTFQQLAALPDPNPLDAVTMGQLDLSLTKLRHATYAAYLLGLTPASALPPPTGGLCGYLANQPANCSNLSSEIIGSSSLLDLELKGDDFQSYYSSTPIDLVGLNLVSSPLNYVPINHVDMNVSTLGTTRTVQLAHPSNFLTCTPTTTVGNCDTLATAQAAGQLKTDASVTVMDLLADSPAAVGHLSLSNLAAGVTSRQNLPVENMPLANLIAGSPYPASGAAYRIEFDLGCSVGSSLVVAPALPAGFRVIPPTVSMRYGSGPAATTVPTTVAADGSIRPAGGNFCSGSQHVVVDLQAEPGTTLGGPLSSGVTVSTGSDSLSLSNQAPVTVVDNMENDDVTTGAPGTAAVHDNVYLGHITPGDLDFYVLPPLPAGSTIVATLSHIPTVPQGKDFDLVGYGAAQPLLRVSPGFGAPGFGAPGFGAPGFGAPGFGAPGFGAPGFGAPGFGMPGFGAPGFGAPANDTSTTFASSGSDAAPTFEGDIPRLNLPLRGYSTQRGTTTETITIKVTETDTTPFLFQVSGYNQSSANEPYAFHIAAEAPKNLLPCAAKTFPHAGSGHTTYAVPTLLPSTTQTLILVNQKRLGDMFGNDTPTGQNASDYIRTKLDALAADPNVVGAIVPLDDLANDSGGNLWSIWDSNQCSVTAANNIVAAANARVDSLRANLTDLRNIVLIGADDMLPMARVADKSIAYNASRFTKSAFGGQDNAISRAAATGNVLGDGIYGDFAPQPFLNGMLSVPQLAVGRLLESPSQIGASIDAFIAAGGRTTTDSAFVTGYIPFDKGAQLVADALAGRVPTDTLITEDPAWNAEDIRNGWLAHASGFNVVNAHYDFYRGLPEEGFLANDETNPFSTADLPSSLAGGGSWTIGCFAGLNIPDIFLAGFSTADQQQAYDWAEAILDKGSAFFAGNSSYGLGDTDVTAFSERLSLNFAQRLDGSTTVGHALSLAKQDYITSLATPGIYDAKSLEELNFFGLPMWKIGLNGQSAKVNLPPTTVTVPDAVTSTQSLVTFSASQTPHVANSGPRGTYYTVGANAPTVVPGQPTQPAIRLPVPPQPEGVFAKGAIIEEMTVHDVPGATNPVYATTIVDQSAFNPEPQVSTAYFPSTLQAVSGAGGQDFVALTTGQFFGDGSAAGTGTQRLIDSAVVSVTSNNDPRTEQSRITNVTSAVQGTSVSVTVTTPDTDVVRGVVILVLRDTSGNLVARHIELVNAGGGQWIGTTTGVIDSGSGQYFAQLQNAAGVVTVDSNKGQQWRLISGQTFSFSFSTSPDAAGLYGDPTIATITPPAGVSTYTVDLDGVVTTHSGQSSVTISGNGGHVLIASGGGVTSAIGVPMDEVSPVMSASTPTEGGEYAKGSTVVTSYDCQPSGVEIVSCHGPSTLDTSTSGPHTWTLTAVDAFGQTWTYTVNYTVVNRAPTAAITSTPPSGTTNTSGTLGWVVSDPDDPISSLTLSCALDGASVPCGPAAADGSGSTTVTAQPQATPHAFTITATDGDGLTATASTSWTVYFVTTTRASSVVWGVPLSARVTFVDPATGNDEPVVGKTVKFYAGRNASGTETPLCTATTSSSGYAQCDSLGPTFAAFGAGGVTAVFETQQPYYTSRDSAGVVAS